MATAVHLRLDAHTRLAPHIQGANPLGAVTLVAGQAHQVNRQGLHVNGDLAGGLRGIYMQQHAFFTAQGTNGGNILNHTDFVVDKHDAGQNGVGADSGLEHVQIKQAVFLHVQISHLEALALQFAHGIQHGLVLGLDGDQMPALVLVEMGRSLERQVVGFGGSAGPDDFARIGMNQVGHMAARLFNRFFRFPAPGMAAAGGVAKMLAQPGNHGVDHARIGRRGCSIVKIDGEMRRHVFLAPKNVRTASACNWRIRITWNNCRYPAQTPNWAHSPARV